MKKLIRDKIPFRMVAKGEAKREDFQVCKDGHQRLYFARRKVDEELEEVDVILRRLGRDDDHTFARGMCRVPDAAVEIADAIDALYTLAAACNLSPQDVDHAREVKREKNGGFDSFILWVQGTED